MRHLGTSRMTGLLVAMIVTLSACSTAELPSTPTSQTQTPTPAPQSTTEKPKTADEFYQAAILEGELNIYTTSTQAQVESLVKAFSVRYPRISVKPYQLKPALMNDRLMADDARKQPVADIIGHSDIAGVQDLVEKKLLAAYVPSTAEKFPASAKWLSPYAWPDRLAVATLMYNTNNIKGDELTVLQTQGYLSMADPRFKGRVGITDPNILASALTFFWDMKDQLGEPAYLKWLEAMKNNKLRLFDSGVPAANAVVSGEVDFVMTFEQFAAQAVAKGAPVAVLFPPKTPAFYATSSILANAPHPNAARLFMEWFMGVEGQSEWLKVYQISVPNPDVKDDRPITKQPGFKPLSAGTYHFVTTWGELGKSREGFLKQLGEALNLP